MSIYEEVEIEDLDYDPVKRIYTYPCPCGDKFSISLEALWDGEDIATCPSCTLMIEIIFDEGDLPPLLEDSDGEEEKKEEENLGEGDVDEGLADVTKKSLSKVLFRKNKKNKNHSLHGNKTEGTCQFLKRANICVAYGMGPG
eukprot:scaffold135711_cov77-Cyclotella_meneghiniana.AAC.8